MDRNFYVYSRLNCVDSRAFYFSGGGEIVAAGTPEDAVKVKRSYSGQSLAPVLGRGASKRKKGQQAAE